MKFFACFIQRPIFTGVLSLIIFILGAISLFRPRRNYAVLQVKDELARIQYTGQIREWANGRVVPCD